MIKIRGPFASQGRAAQFIADTGSADIFKEYDRRSRPHPVAARARHGARKWVVFAVFDDPAPELSRWPDEHIEWDSEREVYFVARD